MSKKSHKKESKPEESETVIEKPPETLCDENWSCDIIFLVENDLPSNNFINMVQQFKNIQTGIKSITKNEILKDVKKEAGKKGSAKSQKKGKDQTPVELTDEQKIMKAIKEGADLPAASLAKVIKKRLMSLKADDIQDRQKLYNEFLQAQKKKIKPLSKAGKKTGKEEEKPIEETYTERAALFIIISGFYEWNLPVELLKEDVPVKAVIKLNERPKKFKENIAPKDLTNLESEKFNMIWLKFWNLYEIIMNNPVNAQLGSDLALICRCIPNEFNDPKVSAKDKKLLVQNEIISITKYIQMLLERHKNYLKNTTVNDFPVPISSLRDASLYKTLTQMVPPECTSVPFILSCIIEQISFWSEEDTSMNSLQSQMEITKSSYIKTISPVIVMNNNEALLKTFHLSAPEINIVRVTKNLLSMLPLFKAFYRHPQTTQAEKLYYNFHLQRLWKQIENKEVGINLFHIYLHWFILCKIKTYYLTKGNCTNDEKNETSQFNNSNNFCTELLDKWINEFITFSVIKLFNEDDEVTITENKADFKENDAAKLEHDSKTEKEKVKKKKAHKGEFRDVKKIKMARKDNLKILQNFLYCFEVLCLHENEKSPKVLDHFTNSIYYEYIEEMQAETMLQVLHESLLYYSKYENFFYSPTNKILLWFHNDIGSMSEEKFSVQLNTLVGFRDFYNDVILPEEIETSETVNETVSSQGVSVQRASLDSDQQDSSKENTRDSITSENDTIEIKKLEEIHFNLGKTKIKIEGLKKTFVSEDGSTITVEIDDIYKTSKDLKINICKIDTELKIYKNINENVNYQTDLNKPDEIFTVILNLPDGTFMNINVEEKNINVDKDSIVAPSRNFFYNNLTITVPSGLIIEVVKNKLDNETYIKQSYITKGPVCNSIWDECSRCFLRNGSIITFKNDKTVDIISSNTVQCNVSDITEVHKECPIESLVIVENLAENKEKTDKLSSKGKKNQKKDIHIEQIIEIQENIQSEVTYEATEHTINSWSGICYKFKDGICSEVIDNNVNLRTIFLPNKQLFIDRNDGIKSLLNEDGHLISMFKNGTKLTTYFYEEEMGIEISDEALYQENNIPRYESVGTLSPMTEYAGVDLNTPEYNRNITDIQESNMHIHGASIDLEYDSSFVSVKLGCIMEHPNYATVEFSPEKDTIELGLPGNVNVIIDEANENKSFNIQVTDNKKINVSFFKKSIEFSSNIIKKQKKQNVSIIKPFSEMNESGQCSHFCTTCDSFGNIFFIDDDGNTKLINTKTELEENTDRVPKRSQCDSDLSNPYFDCCIPKRMFGRFFVINDDYSGYEIINKNDLTFYNLCDKKKYNNVSTVKNPTNGRIDSEMRQYLVYKTHSEDYIVPYKTGALFTLPDRIQRFDLGPTWNPSKSPWLFTRPEGMIKYFKRFSYSDIAKHDDKKIIAVVVKTVQKITDEDEFNAVKIISNSLKKYNKENEEIIKKYKNQNFNDFEIDARLKETQELIKKVKHDHLNLNVNQKVCDVCKLSFGQTDFANYESEDKLLCHDSSEHVVSNLKY